MSLIDIGEVLKKAIVLTAHIIVKVLYGSDELCSGVKVEIEEAIHGTRELSEKISSEGYGLLMLDTKNAFNSVNRAAAL